MAILDEATAAGLAQQLRALAAYGAGKRPSADSVLAEADAAALAFADHLETEVMPATGAEVLTLGTDAYSAADGIAATIIEEGTSGAYGDDSPPAGLFGAKPTSSSWTWPLVAAAAAAAGLYWYATERRG